MTSFDERYLDLLAEECSEVIKAAMKIKRFGDRLYPDGRSGKQVLLAEIGDVFCILDHMNFSAEDENLIEQCALAKVEKLKVYGPDGTYIKDGKRHDQ